MLDGRLEKESIASCSVSYEMRHSVFYGLWPRSVDQT
jgi:hypothetical protein